MDSALSPLRRVRTRAEDDQIGRAIRAVRLSKGLYQTDLARAAGISTQLLCLIEAGQRRLFAGDLMRLARALRCDPALLVGKGLRAAPTGVEVDYAGVLEAAYLLPQLCDVALLTEDQRNVLAGLLKSWLPTQKAPTEAGAAMP